MPHTQREQGGEEKCPTENVPEGAKTIINMFKELKKISKELKKITTTLCHQIENIDKVTKIKRMNRISTVENTVTELH